MKLLAVLVWLLLVAWGAAKLWGWAWASVSGAPIVELHQVPEGWLDLEEW